MANKSHQYALLALIVALAAVGCGSSPAPDTNASLEKRLADDRRGRLNRARSYITQELDGIGSDVIFHSAEFDTNDVYGLDWSNVTVDVSYTHIQTGVRKRIVAKMDSNGERVSMFRESYAVDVETGEKISDWVGW